MSGMLPPTNISQLRNKLKVCTHNELTKNKSNKSGQLFGLE